MTRLAKKERERFYAEQYLRRRGIAARLEDHEHPDFLVHHGGETMGIEIIEYHGGGEPNSGGSKGRKAEAAWETLQDYSDKFRERNFDIDGVGVTLHFKKYRMPPPRSFEAFCTAIATLIRQSTGLADGKKLAIKMNADMDPMLTDYLIGVELFGQNFWSHWEWPAYMNGVIGTTEEELLVGGKLRTYRAPSDIHSSHLVVVGGGPARTRIAAPISAQYLGTYSNLNRALTDGPFATVSILCLRDFIWSRVDGWMDFFPYD